MIRGDRSYTLLMLPKVMILTRTRSMPFTPDFKALYRSIPPPPKWDLSSTTNLYVRCCMQNVRGSYDLASSHRCIVNRPVLCWGNPAHRCPGKRAAITTAATFNPLDNERLAELEHAFTQASMFFERHLRLSVHPKIGYNVVLKVRRGGAEDQWESRESKTIIQDDVMVRYA